MAEKRAAFILRRLRSLGFSKCRWLRTSFSVPSRSIFFFNRRSAFSTDSPFLSLISVNSNSLPLRAVGVKRPRLSRPVTSTRRVRLAINRVVSTGKNGSACFRFAGFASSAGMALPTEPITLTAAQIEGLSRHFSSFRHDVNGCLSLIVAATELIRYNPDVVKRMSATLVEQPPKIAGKVSEFVEECERTLTVRGAEPSWYNVIWKRSNIAASAPAAAVTVTPAEAKSLHGELGQLGKELTQLGFLITGVRALAVSNPGNGAEAPPSVAD